MTFFLLVFFLVYGGMHAYAFFKTKAAFDLGIRTALTVAVFLTVMGLSPLIVRMAETRIADRSVRIIAYGAYGWLGLLFLFSSAAFATDISRFCIFLASKISDHNLSYFRITPRNAFFVSLVFSLSAFTYGYFEARHIRIEQLTLKTSRLPAGIPRLRIVQISDLHLGLIIREEHLKRVIKIVKSLDPDILVSTGDLIDGEVCGMNGLSELIREVRPKYGKYAITGNHEFFAGIENSRCLIENAGFALLRGEALTPGGIINIAGVDDPAAKRFGLSPAISEKELLSKLPREKFTLLLKHRPLADKDSAGLFDLQLSGHAHKGQIFPFTLITALYYPVNAGLAELSGNAHLYVSRGTGTWGPPVRFLAPPEVTVIDIIRGTK